MNSICVGPLSCLCKDHLERKLWIGWYQFPFRSYADEGRYWESNTLFFSPAFCLDVRPDNSTLLSRSNSITTEQNSTCVFYIAPFKKILSVCINVIEKAYSYKPLLIFILDVSISNTDKFTPCHGWWLRCFPQYLIGNGKIIRHNTDSTGHAV